MPYTEVLYLKGESQRLLGKRKYLDDGASPPDSEVEVPAQQMK